jgi:DNA-binding SARP family transcriptional activator
MEFRVLGQLEIVDDGVPVELPPGQRRSLLIDLLLHADEAVSLDRLVEDLWEEGAPATADKIVQLHISHLRRQLGSERIERQAAGYVFHVRPGELDAQLAEQLAADASGAALAERIRLIREALALWRGRALVDVEYQAFARNEAARLEELRLSMQERLFEALLELGEHRELVPDLEALVAEHPLREHLRALLMLALYRSGRQAEALAAYRQGRVRLHDELGLDPGPELQQLERRILEHDSALEPPQTIPGPPPPQRTRRRRGGNRCRRGGRRRRCAPSPAERGACARRGERCDPGRRPQRPLPALATPRPDTARAHPARKRPLGRELRRPYRHARGRSNGCGHRRGSPRSADGGRSWGQCRLGRN